MADDSAGPEVARSKILQLGGEFLSELRGKQLKALMVKYNLVHETDGLSDKVLRPKFMAWLVDSPSLGSHLPEDAKTAFSQELPQDSKTTPAAVTTMSGVVQGDCHFDRGASHFNSAAPGAYGHSSSASSTSSSSHSVSSSGSESVRLLQMLSRLEARMDSYEHKSPASLPQSQEPDWHQMMASRASQALNQSGFVEQAPVLPQPVFPSQQQAHQPPNVPLQHQPLSFQAQQPFPRAPPRPQMRRIHCAEGDDYTARTFWEDTYYRFNSVRTRVDTSRWKVVKNRREAITLAVALDLLVQGKPLDAQEVMIRRITALAIADSQGDRKKAWHLTSQFESVLTSDRVRVDPTMMRHALARVKLETKGGLVGSSSDEDIA